MTNNRKHSRHAWETPVEITVDGERQPGRSVNISRGGLFIATDPVPPFGARVRLHITLPGVPEECDMGCIVRWSKPGEGAGLQFEMLRPIEVWALNKLLKSLDD